MEGMHIIYYYNNYDMPLCSMARNALAQRDEVAMASFTLCKTIQGRGIILPSEVATRRNMN